MKLLKWIQRSRREDAEAAATEALAAKIEAGVERKAALDRDAEARRQSEKLAQINRENHFSAKLTRICREGHALTFNPSQEFLSPIACSSAEARQKVVMFWRLGV